MWQVVLESYNSMQIQLSLVSSICLITAPIYLLSGKIFSSFHCNTTLISSSVPSSGSGLAIIIGVKWASFLAIQNLSPSKLWTMVTFVELTSLFLGLKLVPDAYVVCVLALFFFLEEWYFLAQCLCHWQAAVSFQILGFLGILGILGRVAAAIVPDLGDSEWLGTLSHEWGLSPSDCFSKPNISLRVSATHCSGLVWGFKNNLYSTGRWA